MADATKTATEAAKPAAGNAVPSKPARFDNDPAYDEMRDTGEVILCMFADVQIILGQLHPSYMKSDIGDHMKRFDARLSRLKKEFSRAKA